MIVLPITVAQSWFLAGVCLTSARYRSPSGTMSNKESSDRL